MARENKIQIKFEARGDKALRKAIRELAKAQQELEKNLKKVKTSTQQLSTTNQQFRHRVDANTKALKNQSNTMLKLQGFIAQYRNRLLLAAFALNAFSKTVGRLTALYSIQERAEKKLATALGGVNKNLLEFAAAQQKVTTYGDEVTIQAMSQAAAFTNNEQAIKALTKAAQDMASARGIDLATAMDLITKSVYSSTNALSRYGIEIDNSLKGADRLNAILGKLNQRYGGQAEADITTFAGAVEQMGNAWGDVGEKLGEDLAEALYPIVKLMNSLAVAMQKLPLMTIIKAFMALGVAMQMNNKRFLRLRARMRLARMGMKKMTLATLAASKAFKVLGRSLLIFAAIEGIVWLLEQAFGGVGEAQKNVWIDFDKDTKKVKQTTSDWVDGLESVATNLDELQKKKNSELSKQTQWRKMLEEDVAAYEAQKAALAEFRKTDTQKKVVGALGSFLTPGGNFIDEIKKVQAAEDAMEQQFAHLTHSRKMTQKQLQKNINDLEKIEAKILEIEKKWQEYKDKTKAKIEEDIELASLKAKIPLLERNNHLTQAMLEIREIENAAIKAGLPFNQQELDQMEELLQVKYALTLADQAHFKSLNDLEKVTTKYVNGGLTKYAQLSKELLDAQNEITAQQARLDTLRAGQLAGTVSDEEVEKAEDTLWNYESVAVIIKNQQRELEASGLATTIKEVEDHYTNLWKEVNKLNTATGSQLDTDKALLADLEMLRDELSKTSDEYIEVTTAIEELNEKIFVETTKGVRDIIKKYQKEALTDIDMWKAELENLYDLQQSMKDEFIFIMKTTFPGERTEEEEDFIAMYRDILETINIIQGKIADLNKETLDWWQILSVDSLMFTRDAMSATLEQFFETGKVHISDFTKHFDRQFRKMAADLLTNELFKWIAKMIGLDSSVGSAIYQMAGGTLDAGTFEVTANQNQGGYMSGFQAGGFVPYSYQGGGNVDTVPARLTEGEFVMNRAAVDSIGIENLNRMNRTGRKEGSINISFNGNVLSRDFIENEAIPKIKDAVRRGADLGIS